MAKIAVLGSGVIATALSFPASENGDEVHLVGTFLDHETIGSIQKTDVHPDLGLKVNESVKAYRLEEAADVITDADVVIYGANSFRIGWTGEQFSKLVKPGQKLLTVTKGIRTNDDGTMHILSDMLRSYFNPELAESVSWDAIVGPSVAGELAVHYDTYVMFCGQNEAGAEYLADLFRTNCYRVWTSTDFVGHETGAATKNVYAFAADFAQGVLRKAGKGNDRYVICNYGAAIFAQGQKELRSFIKLMGGDPETSDGLGGVNDMFVTSIGGHSVKAGGYVGEGIAFSEAQDRYMKGVTLGGVAAIKVIGKVLGSLIEHGVIGEDKYPLCRFLYPVVAGDAPPEMPWDEFFQGLK